MTPRLDRRQRFASAFSLALAAVCLGAGTVHGAVMPRGFEDLRLGISAAELRELRPDAETFVIFGEPEAAGDATPDLYLESLAEHPFFDLVDFTFLEDRLCIVKWLLIGQPQDFAARRARILEGGIRKWGAGFEQVVLDVGPADREEPPAEKAARAAAAGEAAEPAGETTEDAEQLLPGLRWRQGGVEILIGFTPSEAAFEVRSGAGDDSAVPLPKVVQLSISEPSCLAEQLESSRSAVRPAPAELSASLFADLQTAADGVLFE